MDLNNSLWSGATLRLPWENILMYREQCKRPVQCNADLLNNVKPNPSTIDVDHLLSVNCWVDSHGEFLWIVCVTNKNGAYSGLHKLNLVNHFPLMVITIQICLSHISLSRFCVHSHVDTEFFYYLVFGVLVTRLERLHKACLAKWSSHDVTTPSIPLKINVNEMLVFAWEKYLC